MTQDWNDEAYYYDDYDDETSGRRWSTLALVLSGLLGVLIGFACAACLGGIGLVLLLLPTSTASATATPPAAVVMPPTPVPVPQPVNPPPPAPEAPPFVSGGLGLSQQEWEQRYGPGSPSETPGFLWYQGTYLVAFQEGNVSYVERRWSPENAATIDDARLQSGELMPAERQYNQTYSPEGRLDLVVDLYYSPSLINRFGGNVWVGGQPGNFTVTYNLLEYGVPRMVITLGNNPS